MIIQIIPIVPVVSKNFQTVGTIMWKHYSDGQDDHMEMLLRRSQTTQTTETTSIAWIELSSIWMIGTIM